MSDSDDLPRPHLSEETAEAYAMGKLSEAQLAQAEEHLLICSGCRAKVEEAESYFLTLREALQRMRLQENSLKQPAAKPSRKFWKSYWPVPVVAAAMLVLFFTVPRGSVTVSPAEVSLSAIRGAQSTSAPVGKALLLNLDTTGLPATHSRRFEVVTSSGRTILEGEAKVAGEKAIAVTGRPLAAGTYWVRLYDTGGTLLREYGLKVQ